MCSKSNLPYINQLQNDMPTRFASYQESLIQLLSKLRGEQFSSYITSIIIIMYNQFTAIDQKPLALGKVVMNPMDIPRAGKKKKKKLHSKNPYKIKKIRIRGEEAMAEKMVDGLMLLKMLHFQHPKEVITANISYKRIIDINEDHLEYFSNLVELNCSENYIPLQKLRKLPAVEKINISHNQIKEVNLEKGGFQYLQDLNMSFNYLEYGCIPQLSLVPCLMALDLSYNELTELPQNMEHFQLLKKINLEGNNFKSDYKASPFWASLATLPRIEYISVARNKIRGIHTQKLAAGNFATLVELDFSYNAVENQHNLICARNFISLKKLIITGNPFALNNQYKGLEMEVYARTGAEVIIDDLNPYYLKTKKSERPPIKFENIVKVEGSVFKKKKTALFGLDLPKEEDLFSDDSDEVEDEQEEEDNEEPMFVTEQVNKGKKKKTKQSKNSISQICYQEEGEPEMKGESSIASMKSSSIQSKKSIEYGQFHKVAAELLGNEKEYKKNFDIHTSYKALKKAVERAEDDL